MKVGSTLQQPCFVGTFLEDRIKRIKNSNLLSKIFNLFKKIILFLCKTSFFGCSRLRTDKSGFYCQNTISICKYNVIETPDKRRLETACITPESLGYKSMDPPTVAVVFAGSHTPFEDQIDSVIHVYAKMGITVECINYGGFGRSEGNVSDESIEIDSETMIQYVQNKYPNSKTIVHGYSLGSYAAIHVANAFSHVDKLVVDRGFYKMSLVTYDILRRFLCNCVARLIYKIINKADFFNNSKKLGSINSSNVLIVTSDLDSVMHGYHADKLKKKLLNAKVLNISCLHSDFLWIIDNKEFIEWIKL